MKRRPPERKSEDGEKLRVSSYCSRFTRRILFLKLQTVHSVIRTVKSESGEKEEEEEEKNRVRAKTLKGGVKGKLEGHLSVANSSGVGKQSTLHRLAWFQ